MTTQSYAERAAAVGTVTTFNLTDLVRVGENLVTIGDFITRAIVLGSILSGNTVTSPSDSVPAWLVKTFDNTPTSSSMPVRAELQNGTLLAALHSAWVAGATGYVLAANALPNKVWVTTNGTAPGAIATDDFWFRPA